MIGIDTSVLVRFFANDDAKQSPSARRLIDNKLSAAEPGHISLVVLAELAWVLTARYRLRASEISDALAILLAEARFVVQDRAAAWAALDLYRGGKVDFADALIAAVDRLHSARFTVTFDKKAARAAGMTLLE